MKHKTTERERRTNNIYKLLMDFRDSNREVMPVDTTAYKDAKSCACCIRIAIANYRLYTIKCVRRGDEIRLIKW